MAKVKVNQNVYVSDNIKDASVDGQVASDFFKIEGLSDEQLSYASNLNDVKAGKNAISSSKFNKYLIVDGDTVSPVVGSTIFLIDFAASTTGMSIYGDGDYALHVEHATANYLYGIPKTAGTYNNGINLYVNDLYLGSDLGVGGFVNNTVNGDVNVTLKKVSANFIQIGGGSNWQGGNWLLNGDMTFYVEDIVLRGKNNANDLMYGLGGVKNDMHEDGMSVITGTIKGATLSQGAIRALQTGGGGDKDRLKAHADITILGTRTRNEDQSNSQINMMYANAANVTGSYKLTVGGSTTGQIVGNGNGEAIPTACDVYDLTLVDYADPKTGQRLVTRVTGKITSFNKMTIEKDAVVIAKRVAIGSSTSSVSGSVTINGGTLTLTGNFEVISKDGATLGGTITIDDTASVTTAAAITAGTNGVITIGSAASVTADSITAGENGTISIGVGAKVNTKNITAPTISVTGELAEGDTILISGLSISELAEGTKVMVGETEFTYGIFGGQYNITAKGDLVLHKGETYLVNSKYEDGQATALGPIGYSTIAKAQAAIADPTKTTITVYGLDEASMGNDLNEDLNTKDFTIIFTTDDSNHIEFNDHNIVIGDAATVDSTSLRIAYTDDINNITFGNITNKAFVAIDNSDIATLNLKSATVGDANLSFGEVEIENLYLADQAGFKGTLTIANSTIGNVYNGVSGLDVDMTGGNTITNVYAEGNADALKFGTSTVEKFVAGYSDATSVAKFDYEGAVNASELYIGGDANKNTIGTLNAKITGGSVNRLYLGGTNDAITGDANITFDGGEFDNVEFAEIAGKANITLSGGHFTNGFEVKNVAGKTTVTLAGGTAISFMDGVPTAYPLSDDAVYYGIVYGASVSGILDGGNTGTDLIVDGNAKVEGVQNFTALNVTGGTLNVAGGDMKSEVTSNNALEINGDITNRRGINAGTISAKNLTNTGLIGVFRENADDPGIVLSGNLVNSGYIKTSVITVDGNFTNTGKITAVGDITVGGSFTNSGEIYFRSTFSQDGEFAQEGGLVLDGVDVKNTGFISAATLTGVKNLTTSKMYITGGAEITGNITIDAGAEVAFTNKADDSVVNGLILGGSITMSDTSALIVSGELSTEGTKTITVNCGDLIGYNEIVRAESGVSAWTIKLTGASAGKYTYVQDDISVLIYSTDEVFVCADFDEDADNFYYGNKLLYGKNAFATVAEAVAAAKGAKIHLLGDFGNTDAAAAGFDVILEDVTGLDGLTAKTVTVVSDSSIKSIVAADALTINADALLTVEETLPTNLPITIDGSAGTGSRLVLDVDSKYVTLKDAQVHVISASGKTYTAKILTGEAEHAGDLFIVAKDNVFFRKDQMGEKPVAFVDGDTFDGATGDALFLGVNVFGTREEAEAAAKANGGTLYLVGFTTDDGQTASAEVPTIYEFVSGGTSNFNGTATPGAANQTTVLGGAVLGSTVFGLNSYYEEATGDVTFVADKVNSSTRIYITGNTYGNVMNGNISASITDSTVGRTYIGAGSFGTEAKPITIDVLIKDSSISAFHGIETETTADNYNIPTEVANADPAARQDINADINIKIYDTVIGGTFTVLNTNNCHWNGHGGTLLQTHFTTGSINVEIGGSTLTDNIRVGLSLEGGGKAHQAFNVPNTLHIVATDANTVTYASYLCEWDAIIVDATAQLQLNTLQYTTIGIGPQNAGQCTEDLDGFGTLTQVMVNMSGYKSGTHAIIVASNRIYTDDALSNITVIGDNDLTGQCELAYIITDGALKSVYVFDKTDDMFVNSNYTDSINGTSDSVTGQEFLFNYNAHTDFEKAFLYANEWGGSITVTGGDWGDIDFQGNDVAIRKDASFESIAMAEGQSSWDEATITIEDGAQIDVLDGSKANVDSTLLIEEDLDLSVVKDFTTVLVVDATATFDSLSGSDISLTAGSMIIADELDLTDSSITIDVTGYIGRPHVIISSFDDIAGYDVSNIEITGENADKFSVIRVDNDIVLKTTIASDTFLNSEYTEATTGTILDDGTYLEYGFNAFADGASAIAGLGSRDNTLTITGGDVAGDLVMNGANFVLTGGALQGVLYATYEKDYRNMSITVGNGSVGGIEMTAQEGSYRVTRGAIALEDGAVVTGSIIGAGDTTLTVTGDTVVAQGIENVKSIVIDANATLATSSIEMAEGGTIKITGELSIAGTNLHEVISTTGGYSVAPTKDGNYYMFEQGNSVYLLDLSRIYFNSGYTDAISGTTIASGDVLYYGINAFSNLNDAIATTRANNADLYLPERNSNTTITGAPVVNVVVTDSTIGTFEQGLTGNQSYTGDVHVVIENSVIANANSYIMGQGAWNSRNTLNGTFTLDVTASTIGGGRLRLGTFFNGGNKTYVLNFTDTEMRGDMSILEDSPFNDSDSVTVNMTNVTAPVTKWWTFFDGYPNEGNGTITVNLKDSVLGDGTNGFRFALQRDNGNSNQFNGTVVTFNVDNTTVNGSLQIEKMLGQDITFNGKATLNATGENKIRYVLKFNEVNLLDASASITGSTMTLRPGGVINIDATGYDGPTKAFIYMSTILSGADEVNVKGLDESDYELIITQNAVVAFDGTIGNIYWNPNYTASSTGFTTNVGDVLIVEGSVVSGVANAFNADEVEGVSGLDRAKLALTAGNKLYVTGTGNDFDGKLFGTVDSEEVTEGDINMVVSDGNFTAEGAIIAAADLANEKVFTGDSTIEIAGGTYGVAAVVDADGNTTSDAIFAEINGTREVAGGTSGLLVTYSSQNMYANLTDFDYMTVKGNIRVRGDISLVDALTIDCNGSLTVDGSLDAESIGSIVLSSSEYEGPSKIVLHSDNLSQAIIDSIEITVDNPADRWFYDGGSNLWLVSSDPSNLYVNASYTDANVTGTTFTYTEGGASHTDLLYYGINALSSMEDAVIMATSDHRLTVTGGVFAGDYDISSIGGSSVYIDGGTVGTLTVGNTEGANLSRVELTGATAKSAIGTLNGDAAGVRLIMDKDAKVTTVNNAQYIRLGLDQSTGIYEANYIAEGGRFVLDLSEFNGRAGNVLSIAGGLNNFLIPVEGQTYSLARVEVTNDATHDYGFYYDAESKNIVSVAMGANSYIRPDANSSLTGTVVDGTTLVYGFNVTTDDTAATYAKGGTVFVNDITTPIMLRPNNYVNAVITHSNLADTRLGPSAADRREGNFTLDVIGSTFSSGNQYLAGRGSGSGEGQHATFIVGTQASEDAEIVDGVWDIKFRALKDEEGKIIARSRHDNNAGTTSFKITENVNMAGGVVNVLFEDYDIRGDFYLFDNVWNVTVGDVKQELKELNVTMTNVNCPDSKWMWLWDPRDSNSTKINLTITDSVFSGGTLSFGLFGNSLTDWHGEADVYINGVTVSGGTFSGGKGADGNEEGMTGTRTLHVVGGTNNINLVKQFTTIEIADGAMLTGNTISLPLGTYGSAGFILRGETGYKGDVKEYAVVGTTITGGTNTDISGNAQFLDANDNVIDGYVAVVGATNVFIYTQDGAVYYNTSYTAETTGVAIEADEVSGKKNFLVFGDNAVAKMEDAYTSADLRDTKVIVVEGANDSALYANGYKLVVSGGNINTLYGSSKDAAAVEFADITLNSGISVTNVVLATETSGITGNALVTVADDAVVGTLNGATEFVGGTSKLVFEGNATAFSISNFDDVTIQANSEVTIRNMFSGASLTIDTTDFTGASKRVMTVTGGVDPEVALTINAGAFSTEWVNEGKTLVLVSNVVTDVYVNTAWTEADVTGKFVGDMLLVWNKNAFNNIAGGAAAVGKDSVLSVEGDFQYAEALAFSNADVVLNGATVGLGAVTGADTALTVASDKFTATSLSGISALSVKADAATIGGAIAMTGEGKLTIDVTGHSQSVNDVVVLSTEGGITGLDKDITVTGTDANHYYAYYSATDGDIHLLRIDNLYVDVAFGTAGELIPEGATNVITHEPYVFGANAFYSIDDAVAKLADGMGLYINGYTDSVNTNNISTDLYLTNSNIPVLINGFTNGDIEYTGDINVTIMDSTISAEGNSTLVAKTMVGDPWNHLTNVTGNISVNVSGSTLGSESAARTVNGSDYLRVTNGNFTFNVSDSVIYSNLEVLGDSPIANDEVVSVNFKNVTASVSGRNIWVTDGNQNNAGTINITLDKVNFGDIQFATQSDWNYGDRNSSNKVTFNVSDATIGGSISADCIGREELTGYSGAKVLNITGGSNAIGQVLWFKEININATSTLNANVINMSSASAKVVVDATEFSGKSRVIVSAAEGIANLTDDNVSGKFAPESTYDIFTDYNDDAKTMTSIVIKGDLKDIYANEDYTLEDLTVGTSYNGEALFCNFNAFDTADAALAALTVEGASLFVTGNLSYEGPEGQVLTINNDLINDGTFKLSSKGFVDGSQSEAKVLTAKSITGDGKFTTDNASYTAVVRENSVYLVLKKVDVYVSTTWAELEDGSIVEIPGGTAMIGTDAFATADAAASKVSANGTITVLASDVKFSSAIVRTVTATSGSTIQNANIGTSNGAGSLTLESGATATNAQVRNGSTLTVSDGAKVTSSLKISDGAVVTFGANTALDLDISASTTESAAVMTGYSLMTGSPAISITIAADQADGIYAIATDAAAFGTQAVTLKTVAATITSTLTLGNTETIEGIEYTLGMTEDDVLTLTKKVYEEPITVTYVNPAWADLADGAVVTISGATAIVGKDAFADADLATEKVISTGIVKVVAGKVTFANGITKQTEILSGAELTNTNVSSVLTVNAGATLSGTAVFGEGANVTVNGTVVFDLALSAESAQFTGFAVAGEAQYKLVGESAVGDYTLATGVAAFTSLTVGDQTLAVGSSIIVDDAFTYALSLNEGTLALNIAEYVPPVVIPAITYVNSAWATKQDGAKFTLDDGTQVTYKYDAFATGDEAIAAVSADGIVEVLGGTVSFTAATDKKVHISDDATLFGKNTFGRTIVVDGTVAFDTKYATATEAQIGGYSYVASAQTAVYTLNADAVAGTYLLASDAAKFDHDVVFGEYTLKVGAEAITVGSFTYQLGITANSELALIVEAVPEPPTPSNYFAKFDINGNKISDVMFQYTGGDYQLGYWLDGTSQWQGTGIAKPVEWDVLGAYDMTGNGKADSVLFGNVTTEAGIKGAYVGYYKDANDQDANWVTIGYLTNEDDIVWKNKVGNLTGNEKGTNSIVWYAPELYALGAWTDGTETWAQISGTFGGSDWTLVGCGDFDGDGKDSIVMSGLNGQYLYWANVDGTTGSFGSANWAGWEVRAIGDFLGDGKDDMVLFHKDSGSMVMIADGNIDDFKSLDQLDANDWFVVGAGDYNNDQKDDLLVRQYSTGMLGYYVSGDTQQWVELGRGVDMNWTVIA